MLRSAPRPLAADKGWEARQRAAAASCATVQYGAHIDSLPVEPPLPPIMFAPVVYQSQQPEQPDRVKAFIDKYQLSINELHHSTIH
jgi:hypothetical protein